MKHPKLSPELQEDIRRTLRANRDEIVRKEAYEHREAAAPAREPGQVCGWFRCEVNVQGDPLGLVVILQLWWNSASKPGTGWWIGLPGRTERLESIFPNYKIVNFEVVR